MRKLFQALLTIVGITITTIAFAGSFKDAVTIDIFDVSISHLDTYIFYFNIIISLIAIIFFVISIKLFYSMQSKAIKTGMHRPVILMMTGFALLVIALGLRGEELFTGSKKTILFYGYVVYQKK